MPIQQLDLQDDAVVQRVLDIQQASYAIEAALIGTTNIPPLHDTKATLQNSSEVFFGYWIDGVMAGLTAFTCEEGTLDICRMAVHPDYFRRGIARQLLAFIQGQFANVGRVIVSTGSRNVPAKQLYERDGFVQTGEAEVEPGVFLTLYEKKR